MTEAMADLRMTQGIEAAAHAWTTAGRDESYLLVGARLAEVEAWLAEHGSSGG